MRLLVGLVILGMFAWGAEGLVLMQESVATTPTATIPVRFAANPGIATILGATATNATVNNVLLALGTPANTLRVEPNATANWSLRLRVLNASGLTGADIITVGLTNGTPHVVVLTSGVTFPQTTEYVRLASGGPHVNITAQSTTPLIGDCGGLTGNCTLTMQVLFTPTHASGPAPEFAYNYRLNLL